MKDSEEYYIPVYVKDEKRHCMSYKMHVSNRFLIWCKLSPTKGSELYIGDIAFRKMKRLMKLWEDGAAYEIPVQE